MKSRVSRACRYGLGIVLTSVLLACAGRSARQSVLASSIEGHWGVGSGVRQLELMLAVRGTRVTGTGLLTRPTGEVVPLTVRGEYSPPAFSLDFSSHDRIVARYSGRYSLTDTMRGILEDMGVPTDSLILNRLPGGASPRLFRAQWN